MTTARSVIPARRAYDRERQPAPGETCFAEGATRMAMAQSTAATSPSAPAGQTAQLRAGRHARVRLRFFRFALIGGANTAVTIAVFNLCTAVLHLPAAEANVLGWIAGFANSFAWNRSWTFRDRRDLPTGRVLPRFALASLAALAVSEGVVIGLHAAIFSSHFADSLPHAVALNAIEVVAIGCSLGVNYALSLRWAFRAS